MSGTNLGAEGGLRHSQPGQKSVRGLCTSQAETTVDEFGRHTLVIMRKATKATEKTLTTTSAIRFSLSAIHARLCASWKSASSCTSPDTNLKSVLKPVHR